MRHPPPSQHWCWHVAAAGVLLSVTNLLKVLHIDDPVYAQFAREFAQHPLHPYTFMADVGAPAMDVLAPPALPYWVAAWIRLLGDSHVILKLSMAPFAFLFAWAVHRLGRRFNPGMENALLWFLSLSPVYWPSLNLMLDLPALGLQLASLEFAFRACQTSGWANVIISGLLGSLAMETKYSTLFLPAILILLGLARRQPLRLLLAAVIAILGFAGCEAFLFWADGASHFLHHLGQRTGKAPLPWAHVAMAMLQIVGATAGGLVPLSLLRWPRWIKWSAAAVPAIFLVMTFPAADLLMLEPPWSPTGMFTSLLLVPLGLIVVGRSVDLLLPKLRRWRGRGLFIVAWLGVEIVGAAVLSPFFAVRRIMGLVVPLAILFFRPLRLRSDRRAILLQATASGAVVGMIFAIGDVIDANAQQSIVNKTMSGLRQRFPEQTVWFVGTWGFGEWARAAGMEPIAAESKLRPGDFVVVPDGDVVYVPDRFDPSDWEIVAAEQLTDRWPWRVAPHYYGGALPIVRVYQDRINLTVYRLQTEATGKARSN